MTLIERNKEHFLTVDASDTDGAENITIDKKTFKSSVAASFCQKCKIAGDVSFHHVQSDVFISVTCSVCEEVLFSNCGIIDEKQ